MTYILPTGDYEVQVFGTGSGPATIRFETPGDDGPGFAAFSFDATEGVNGTVSLTGNVPAAVLSYGSAFVPSTAGLMLSIAGAPAALPLDTWTEVTVEVATSTGQPAPGATVHATTPDGTVDARPVAGPDGSATFSIRPITPGLPITLEVSGPGYAPATVTIETAPDAPPPPDAAAEVTATATPSSAVTATPTTDGSGASEDGGGSSSTLLIVIGAAVALVAAGGFFVWRRRSGAPE